MTLLVHARLTGRIVVEPCVKGSENARGLRKTPDFAGFLESHDNVAVQKGVTTLEG